MAGLFRLTANKPIQCLKYLPVGFQWRPVNLYMLWYLHSVLLLNITLLVLYILCVWWYFFV